MAALGTESNIQETSTIAIAYVCTTKQENEPRTPSAGYGK